MAPTVPQAVVIVDPFSSGGIPFIEDLKENGAFVVAILSNRLLADSWIAQWKPELYDACMEYDNIEDTVAFIKDLGVEVKAIFPGSEPGVNLAEDLREHFDNVGKNSGSSDVRRHKHTMHKALHRNGVRGIVETLTGDVDKAISWIKNTTQYPVIVKPPMSGGSDGLYFCHSDNDVQEAFSQEAGKLNVNGVMNTELLVQEFLDGTEYVVDAISYEGRHLIFAIWRYSKLRNKETKAITYEYSDFLPFEGPEQSVLREYVYTALDALGVKFGASHNEIIIDSRGPCLVESGARLHGGIGGRTANTATGFSPVGLLTDIALYNARLFNELYKANGYILKQHCLVVDLCNFKYEGILAKSIEEEIRKKLSTIRTMNVQKVGTKIEITRDMMTSPGDILISHPNKEFLMEDYARLRELENNDLYMVMEESASIEALDESVSATSEQHDCGKTHRTSKQSGFVLERAFKSSMISK